MKPSLAAGSPRAGLFFAMCEEIIVHYGAALRFRQNQRQPNKQLLLRQLLKVCACVLVLHRVD